jgi:hypothetical protein
MTIRSEPGVAKWSYLNDHSRHDRDYHTLLFVLYLSVVYIVFVCCAVSGAGRLAVSHTVSKQKLLLLLLYFVLRFNE